MLCEEEIPSIPPQGLMADYKDRKKPHFTNSYLVANHALFFNSSVLWEHYDNSQIDSYANPHSTKKAIP